MTDTTQQDLIDSLRSEWERTAALFAMIPPEGWDVVIYDEAQRWTTRHIVVHLCDAETQFRRMLTDSLNGGEGSPPGVDIDRHNGDAVPRLYAEWANDSNAELVERLAGVRAELIRALAQFPPDAMQKSIRHPLLGMITLENFIRAAIIHAKMHGRDVKRRLVP
jgi:hypothetical protein